MNVASGRSKPQQSDIALRRPLSLSQKRELICQRGDVQVAEYGEMIPQSAPDTDCRGGVVPLLGESLA